VNRSPVSAALLLAQAEQLLAIELAPARAAELAKEVQKLNDAVRAALPQLDFNDDPARFSALLVALKAKTR
jgi:hypothetical protein